MGTNGARELTPKQQRFVEEYLIDLNATQAYIRAGYVARGNAAEVNAARLLRNAQVAAAITAGQKKRSEETQIDAAWVLRRLAAQDDADLADLYQENGQLKPIREWPEVWRKGLVVGVEVFEEFGQSEDGRRELIGHTKKIKLLDRIKNLELIGKHVGVQAFREKVELTGKHDGPVQIDVAGMSTEALRELMEARRRAAK